MKIRQYSICNSSVTYNALVKQQDALLRDAKWNPGSCNCLKPCNELLYTTKFDMRYVPNNTNSRSVVKIYYEDMTYERIEENLSYGIVSLLCDIGGNLGLFLGACVISIFEIVEIIAVFVINKIMSCPRKQKVQYGKCESLKMNLQKP